MIGLGGNGVTELVPEGGRVCSLEYRPRRWFGFRLERVLADFLATERSELAGLGAAVADLLQGAVRPGSDRKVRVSAHHSRAKGVVLVTVELTYRIPSSDPEHVWAIVGWLGRAPREGSYFRLGTQQGELPVRATLAVDSEVLGTYHGETELRTTLVVQARTRSRRGLDLGSRGAEPGLTRGRVVPIRGS